MVAGPSSARPPPDAMTPEHWQQVKEILEEALDRGSEDRTRFLDEACGRNQELRRDVEALLALEGEVAPFLEVPAFDLHQVAPEASLEGRIVDRYRIVREIGTGGMGRVYLGERADSHFEQRVAVKVLKRGLDSAEIVTRFQRERQILADLEHPNIARILDGGTTEEGLPYLVAEYVEGSPIDLYCQRRGLGVEQRLELFCQVCEAVQFAHQNLVVHRDLKAGNILIADGGIPKLLDFGIAKILSPNGDDAYRTRLGLHFMTPEVASPEQLRGERVTTASDVYSLGVLLYALVTGRNPHTTHGTSRAAIEQAVREHLPERPSLAAPPELRRKLRGDLDNIILKALRKEPERRYATPRELADDLQRYLAGRPVEASGDAWSYRLPKLLKRHKVAAASLAGFVLLIAAFTVIAVSLLSQTTRERQRAERVSTFLEELLTESEPAQSRGKDLTVREVLDTGREKVLSGLEEEPDLQAELMNTMARVYQSLGLYGDARSLFQRALAIRRRVLGPNDLLVAQSLTGLAGTMRSLGDIDATEKLLRQALAIQNSHHAENRPEFVKNLNNLAILYEERGKYQEAEELHRQVLAAKKRNLAPEDPEIAVSLHNLAKVLYLQGEYKEAEERYREALKLRELHYGTTSPEVARTLNSLASTVEALGHLDEAEELYRRSLEIRRTLYPDGHPELAVSLSNLAMLLQDRGDLAAAEPLFREALSILDRFLPKNHPNRAVVMRNLASLLTARGAASEAEELARQALEIFRRSAEPGSWRIADAESVLGGALVGLKRYDEASSLLLRGYSVLADLQGKESPYTRQARKRLVEFYTETGDPARASQYSTPTAR